MTSCQNDDYHVLDSQAVDQALTFLIKHLPPQLHLVIATREDPNLPLARLRVRSQLTEVRAADLRFTPAEAAAFLNQVMGLTLSADEVAALEKRTEGWIAGLQLAAISMQAHNAGDHGVASVFMVPLVLAVHERLKDGAPVLSQMAAAIGLIWTGLVIASGMIFLKDIVVIAELYSKDPTQAVTIWPALTAVESALGGGIALPGGLWALLVSWAALRTGSLPKALNYLGLVIGMAGILMLVPAFAEPGSAIFGLGFIAWFLWAGIVMVRNRPRGTTARFVHRASVAPS